MQKVLITGATGYIGRALCLFLSTRGYQVLAMTRGSPDLESQVPGVRYIESDYQSFGALDDEHQIEAVIHLAARAHVADADSSKSYELFRDANVEITTKLAHKVVELKIPRFLFISTIGVNGLTSGTRGPLTEEATSMPHGPYSQTKYEAEKQIRLLFNSESSSFTILRLPLVYSADAPGNFMKLLALVSRGLPLPFGAIRNKRSVLSLENLLDCIERCCWHDGARNEMFLVADEEVVSTRDIVKYLTEGMQKKNRQLRIPSNILYWGFKLIGRHTMFIQLCQDLEIDSSRIRHSLNWYPSVASPMALRASGEDYIKKFK